MEVPRAADQSGPPSMQEGGTKTHASDAGPGAMGRALAGSSSNSAASPKRQAGSGIVCVVGASAKCNILGDYWRTWSSRRDGSAARSGQTIVQTQLKKNSKIHQSTIGAKRKLTKHYFLEN